MKRVRLICIHKAKKNKNNLNDDRDCKVTSIKVSKGDSVLEGTDLVIIE